MFRWTTWCDADGGDGCNEGFGNGVCQDLGQTEEEDDDDGEEGVGGDGLVLHVGG